jgi:hypothetical protein
MTTSIPKEQTKTAPATAATKTRVAKRRAPVASPKSTPGRKATAAKKTAPGTPANGVASRGRART